MVFARADDGLLAHWWWQVDRVSLGALLALGGLGLVFLLAASPGVALRLGYDDPMHFALRQALFWPAALVVLLGCSLLSETGVRRLGVFVFALSILLLLVTLRYGDASRGAQRWLDLGVTQLQPSEIAKPGFAVLTAWLLARYPGWRGYLVSLVPFTMLTALVAVQPDTGAALTIAAVFIIQLFLAGLPWLLVFVAIGLGAAGLGLAYTLFGHVRERLDRYIQRLMDPETAVLHDQEQHAFEALLRGGWFGQGPGMGEVKDRLSDAHADFIVAVVIEEYGLVAVVLLVLIFALIVLRGLIRLDADPRPFPLIAASGLLAFFALQAVINIGVNIGALPTKGMTLPFVSYGGSALLAMAFTLGCVLALTRRRPRDGAL